MNRSAIIEYLLHGLTFFVCTSILYGAAFADWGSFLMGSGEDTMKNFYTFAYHILHGEQWFWFTGMNHPFGEHLTFTDNQAPIALLLKAVHAILPLNGQLVWILTLLLIVSFQWGAYFLFRSLMKLGVGKVFALFASVAIMLISPQWARLGGHYSLAHGFFLPLLIYLLLSERTVRNGIWVVLLLLTAGFIHPYFLAMGSLFTGLYLGLELITTRALRDWKQWLLRLSTVILPLLLFQAIITLTDPVIDRPDVPYGFLYFRATFTSIILPLYADYAIHIMRLFPGWASFSNEGFFYVGAAATLGSIIASIGWIAKAIAHRNLTWTSDHQIWILLLASIPVMLLSIGMPFTLEGFEHYLDHTGPLRQFRGIGRFAFVFYYALNVFAFVMIAKVWDSLKVRAAIWSVMIMIFLLELIPYQKHIISHTVSETTVSAAPEAIDPSNYDAILPIPYFHVGSENFGTRKTEYIAKDAMRISLGTGIPLVGVQMSRTSMEQTVQQLQLTGEHLQVHPYATAHSQENWLLLVDRNHALKASEAQLIRYTKQVGSFEQYDLRSLSLTALKDLYADQVAAVRAEAPEAVTVQTSVDSLDVTYHSFDDANTALHYRGGGALAFDRKDWTPLISKGTTFQKLGTYELSFWVHYTDAHAVNTQVWFWERKNDQDVQFEVSEVAHHVVAFDGEWALCSIVIVPQESGSSFELLLHRDEPMTVWVDEVLLRPLNLDVQTGKGLNLNNRYYKPIGAAAVDLANIEP